MEYYYYILHISVENKEEFLGPFSSEKARQKAIRNLRSKLNRNLRDYRVRARLYPVNVTHEVAVEMGMVKEAA